MPHKFLNQPNFNGDVRFQTHGAILDIVPYKPVVLIIGTYNEGAMANNPADFFYGRNFFWPVLVNLSNNANGVNRIALNQRRDVAPIPPGIPTLNRILELCDLFKLTFADLITNVLIPLPNHNDNHLNRALSTGKAVANHLNIINFINNTPSIKHVYITTKMTNHGYIEALWNNINNIIAISRPNVTFGKILTPAGMGGIPNFNGLNRAATIARYWLWVNNINPANPHIGLPFANATDYSHFDHQWLTTSGVNPALF